MDSLLATTQLELLPADPDGQAQLTCLETDGEYTGERLFRQRPGQYRLVVELLAEGSLSHRQIAHVARVSRNTVSAVARREAVAIEPLKKDLSRRYRHIARLCAERIEEMLLGGASLSLKDLSIAAGIAIEKSELLGGGVTQRFGLQASEPTAEDWLAELARWRSAREIDASEIEMGLGGGKPEQNAGAGAALPAAAVLAAGSALPAAAALAGGAALAAGEAQAGGAGEREDGAEC